jgi:hypothetical protein
MQPDNNEFQPQTNNTPEPQPQQPAQAQPWQPAAPVNTPEPQPTTQPETQAQPEAAPATVEQPQAAPQPPQPQQPVFTQPQVAQPLQPAHDPGKVFSILGLVFAFIALQLPGLILSIIGLKKSKKAGFPTTLAVVGIILNILFMVITIGVIAAISFTAYNGIQQRAAEQGVMTNATSVLKQAEVHNAESGSYPTIDQLRSTPGTSALTDEQKAALKDTATPADKEIGYQTCTDAAGVVTGANIYVYSVTDQKVMIVGPAGTCDGVTFSADDTSYMFEQE